MANVWVALGIELTLAAAAATAAVVWVRRSPAKKGNDQAQPVDQMA